jgi:hypothetical protein
MDPTKIQIDMGALENMAQTEVDLRSEDLLVTEKAKKKRTST